MLQAVWGGAGRRLDRYPQCRPGWPAAVRPVLQPGCCGAAGAALLSCLTPGPHHARQAPAVGGGWPGLSGDTPDQGQTRAGWLASPQMSLRPASGDPPASSPWSPTRPACGSPPQTSSRLPTSSTQTRSQHHIYTEVKPELHADVTNIFLRGIIGAEHRDYGGLMFAAGIAAVR